jgi:hypothetical protein
MLHPWIHPSLLPSSSNNSLAAAAVAAAHWIFFGENSPFSEKYFGKGIFRHQFITIGDNMRGCLRFFFSYFEYRQIWLNTLYGRSPLLHKVTKIRENFFFLKKKKTLA